MKGAIAFVLGNFTLTFFVLGLIASAIALWLARQPRSPAGIVEALFSYFLLFSIAIANFYNFVVHVFFGKTAAAFIGWADSPFQRRWALPASVSPLSAFWRSKAASTCGSRLSSAQPASCGAPPASTSTR
jgi:hypothetical protein